MSTGLYASFPIRFFKLLAILTKSLLIFVKVPFRKQSPPTRVTFIVHIHYLSGVSPALRFMRRIGSSTIYTSSSLDVIAKLRARGKHVVSVENVGRNFGGLFASRVLEETNTEFICHLHWKRSSHSPILGSIWNFILWSRLTSQRALSEIEKSHNSGERILALVDLRGVFSRESRGWGKSQRHLSLLDKNRRYRVENSKEFLYPIGGMFLCSRSLFTEYSETWAHLSPYCEKEPIGNDGEVVHFFERYIGATVSSRTDSVVFL